MEHPDGKVESLSITIKVEGQFTEWRELFKKMSNTDEMTDDEFIKAFTGALVPDQRSSMFQHKGEQGVQ